MKKLFILLTILIIPCVIYSQSLIGSFDQKNMDSFFDSSISGFFNEVQSFSFNTVSESEISKKLSFRLLDVYSLNTVNTFNVHGMNDESFWQGKGINSYLTGGLRADLGNFSMILYPEFWYAQNSDFNLTPPASNQESEFGFFMGRIDNPQRYGDKYFFFAGLGQSEIRYTGKKLTIGIGSQSLWLGPGIFNSLILSNNAGGFPKLDIGMRNLETPAGELEFYLWWGLLNESEYFDNIETNNLNLFTGIHIDYKPVFIDGLTIGLNRTLTSNFLDAGISSYGTLFIPFMSSVFGEDENDQRASVTLDWLFPSVGFNAYLEWARNDYQPMLRSILQFPQHTQAYTLGVRQLIYKESDTRCLISFEVTNLLVSWDYTIEGSPGASFYTHGIVLQGYTQNGQILGAGIGTGSSSQTLKTDLFFSRGYISGFLQRVAVTSDYLYTFPQGDPRRDTSYNETELTIGVEGAYKFFYNQRISGKFEYTRILNRNYIKKNDQNNFHMEIGYTLSF